MESEKLDTFKVVRVRLNRSYLCRWATNPQLHLQDTLRDLLGVDDQVQHHLQSSTAIIYLFYYNKWLCTDRRISLKLAVAS